MNNLPKDYIRVSLTCRSLAELFNFIGLVEIQEYISLILKQSVTEYINKFKHIANKIFDFLLCFKGIRCNKLEIDFNIGGGRLGHLDLVTHPDMNPVQPSLTLVNRREHVFFFFFFFLFLKGSKASLIKHNNYKYCIFH